MHLIDAEKQLELALDSSGKIPEYKKTALYNNESVDIIPREHYIMPQLGKGIVSNEAGLVDML